MDEARATAKSAGGGISCKATSDPRMRECSGRIAEPGGTGSLILTLSSINDSAAVILLSGAHSADGAPWVTAAREAFGTPNHQTGAGMVENWQWIRRGQMLRIVRRANRRIEWAVNLTYGPLLDGLGAPKRKMPDKQSGV